MRYAADEAFELPSLTKLVAYAGAFSPPGALTLSDGVTAHHRMDAVYFDTADLRLTAAGVTLRRLTAGEDSGWQLKLRSGTATPSEVRLPPGRVPPGRTPRAVPAQLQSMVWAHTLGHPLRPVARITTDRWLRRLTDPTGQVLLEVADDQVTAQRVFPLDGAGEAVGAATRWRQIEVEVGDGAGELNDVLDTRLRKRGLRTAPAQSKLAHLLAGEKPRRRARGQRATPADG